MWFVVSIDHSQIERSHWRARQPRDEVVINGDGIKSKELQINGKSGEIQIEIQAFDFEMSVPNENIAVAEMNLSKESPESIGQECGKQETVTSEAKNQTDSVDVEIKKLQEKILSLQATLSRANRFIEHIRKEKEELRQENERITAARPDPEDGVNRCFYCGWRLRAADAQSAGNVAKRCEPAER